MLLMIDTGSVRPVISGSDGGAVYQVNEWGPETDANACRCYKYSFFQMSLTNTTTVSVFWQTGFVSISGDEALLAGITTDD